MGDGAEQSPNEQKKEEEYHCVVCRVVRMIYFLFYSDHFCADTKAFIPMATRHIRESMNNKQMTSKKSACERRQKKNKHNK